ncbi:ABC transporter ATP-binding protein [Melghirimyces algeriensis]|uniref:ABC-2 type transport system ATP-binding protein n=1 Tax=Melghirimyces algeriensis TaxID=910412 RepID=A0A521FC35_9BACL|nr:ABC transporter ATP-binding protein [Melghirimyces algeriensis]SMO93060.1 ABC-2 type transport system ATP-binding protein [Melghirimyces algeriensis]
MQSVNTSASSSEENREHTEWQELAVEVQHLHKAYEDHVAVDDISFTVKKGEIFVLVGPNGAGKTTAVECMEGLRKPDRGSVRLLGMDPRNNREKIFQHVGVQLQENNLHPRQKVYETLEVFSSFYSDPAPYSQLIERCGLEGKENDFYGKLSGGQKRRLLMVLALLGRPKLVILDEPTSGLDPQARYNIWKLLEELKRQGTTIFLTTHYMNEAEEHGDTLCMIDEGRVIAMGEPKKLLAEHQMGSCIKIAECPNLDEKKLKTFPQVGQVEKVDGHFLLYGSGKDFLPMITSKLGKEGVTADQIEARKANLEDLYLLMTGRAYRKET